jgi:glutaredoxin-like protein NrdH
MTKVEGKNREHKVEIFTLTTCGWCKKTKKLLNELEVDYEYFDIDNLNGEEGNRVREEMRKHNPRMSAPTIVIDDGKHVIVGFKEEEIRRHLGNG